MIYYSGFLMFMMVLLSPPIMCGTILNVWKKELSQVNSMFVSFNTGNVYFTRTGDVSGGQHVKSALIGSKYVHHVADGCTIGAQSLYTGVLYVYCERGVEFPKEFFGETIVQLPITYDDCYPLTIGIGVGLVTLNETVYLPCFHLPERTTLLVRIEHGSDHFERVFDATPQCQSITSIATTFTPALSDVLFASCLVSRQHQKYVLVLTPDNLVDTVTFDCPLRGVISTRNGVLIHCFGNIFKMTSRSNWTTLLHVSSTANTVVASFHNSTFFVATSTDIIGVDDTTGNTWTVHMQHVCVFQRRAELGVSIDGTLYVSCSKGIVAFIEDTSVQVLNGCQTFADFVVSSLSGYTYGVCAMSSYVSISPPFRKGGNESLVKLPVSCAWDRRYITHLNDTIFVACLAESKLQTLLMSVHPQTHRSVFLTVMAGFVTGVTSSTLYGRVYVLTTYILAYAVQTGHYERILPPVLFLVNHDMSGLVYAANQTTVFSIVNDSAIPVASVERSIVDITTVENGDVAVLTTTENRDTMYVRIVHDSHISTLLEGPFVCLKSASLQILQGIDVVLLCDKLSVVYISTLDEWASLLPDYCERPMKMQTAHSYLYVDCRQTIMSIDPSCGHTPGWSVNNGVCTKCNPGYFRSLNATHTSIGCSMCERGRASDAFGAGECDECERGSFGESNVVCFPCSVGRFVNSTGKSSCDLCPSGRFSNVSRSSMCNSCALGKYTTNTGSGKCTDCLAGFFSNVSGMSCEPCVGGRYSSVSGSTSCSGVCEAGYSCPPGSSSSRQFPCGSRAVYCPSGIGSPLLVERGYFSTNCTTNTTCSSQQICKPGWYCEVGVSRPCAPGSRSGSYGSVVCELCPAGKHQRLWAQSDCAPCGVMRGQPLSVQVSCEKCPPNYYSPPSIGQCQACLPPLVIRNNSECTTFSCDKGEYFENSECRLCPPGKYSSVVGPTLSCQAAPPNTYAPLNGTDVPYSCIGLSGMVCYGGRAYTKRGYWAYQVNRELGTVAAKRCLAGYCRGDSRYDGDQCAAHRVQSSENVLCGRCKVGYMGGEHGGECVACASTNVGMLVLVILLTFVVIVFLHVASHQDKRGATISVSLYFIQICVVMVGVRDGSVAWMSLFNFSSSSATPGACIIPLSVREMVVLELVEPWLLFVGLGVIMGAHSLIEWCFKYHNRDAEVLPWLGTSLLSVNSSDSQLFASRDVWHYVCVSPFKRDAWWYASFVLVRRAIVAIFDVFLVLDPPMKYCVFCSLHVVFLLVHLHVRPYHYERDNILETVTLFLLTLLAILLSLNPPPLESSMIVTVFVLVTIPSFLLLLYIVSSKYMNSRRARAQNIQSLSFMNRIWQELGTFRSVAYYQTVVSMLLYSYTQLFSSALRFLYCVDVGDRWRVVYFAPAISCESSWYKRSRVGVLVLLVYLVCLPFFILWISYNRHSRKRTFVIDDERGDDAISSELSVMRNESFRSSSISMSSTRFGGSVSFRP